MSGDQGSGFEWRRKRGHVIECRVDPKNEKRVLLLAPEPDERKVSVVDSTQILSKGKRARATVRESKHLEMTAPGTEDAVDLLRLELRSDGRASSLGRRDRPAGAEVR